MEDVNGKKSYMKKTLVDHYVLIKDLNKFMYDETKEAFLYVLFAVFHFWRYVEQA